MQCFSPDRCGCLGCSVLHNERNVWWQSNEWRHSGGFNMQMLVFTFLKKCTDHVVCAGRNEEAEEEDEEKARVQAQWWSDVGVESKQVLTFYTWCGHIIQRNEMHVRVLCRIIRSCCCIVLDICQMLFPSITTPHIFSLLVIANILTLNASMNWTEFGHLDRCGT